jgi:hypothetical protein
MSRDTVHRCVGTSLHSPVRTARSMRRHERLRVLPAPGWNVSDPKQSSRHDRRSSVPTGATYARLRPPPDARAPRRDALVCTVNHPWTNPLHRDLWAPPRHQTCPCPPARDHDAGLSG